MSRATADLLARLSELRRQPFIEAPPPSATAPPAHAFDPSLPLNLPQHPPHQVVAHPRAGPLQLGQGEVSGWAATAASTMAVFAPRGALAWPTRASSST